METINNFQKLRQEPNGGSVSIVSVDHHPHATVELLKYWRVLKPHRNLIVIATFVAMAGTVLVNIFLVTTLYQAKTIIAPMSPDSQTGIRSAGNNLLSSAGEGIGGLAMSLMGKSDTEQLAAQDVAILNTYDFTMNLVKRFQLANKIIVRDGRNPAQMTPWKIYGRINDRFNTEYDFKSANLTLYYIDRDPAVARQVLGYYLESLRSKLRNEEVATASVAIKALEEEVSHTTDALLRDQLYLLMADQIQREKTAQMEADFAFKVVEPPMVPDTKYSPHIGRQAALVGVLMIFVMSAYFLIKEWLYHAQAHLNALEASTIPPNGQTSREERLSVEERLVGVEKLRPLR